MELEGVLKQIGETQTFGNNGFRKREFIITTEDQYPQHIQLELVQDKCSLLDKYAEGERVKVSINIRGREWVNPQGETRYFNTIQGWRIENLQEKTSGENIPPVPPKEAFETSTDLEEEQDVPF